MPETELLQCDGEFNKIMPPQVKWVVGNWPLQPPAKALGPQAASRALALQLVQQVAADADTHEIEALLRRDPTLSYHLLRLVNSLGMGTGRKITSFSQAILILGRQQLRRWLNLMLFAAKEGDVRSAMLLSRVAVRARAIEMLAKARGLDKPTQEQGFMAGMFSLLGILFGMPLAEVLAPLAISENVQRALLGHEGELGALLRLVESAEGAKLSELSDQLSALQLDADEFNAVIVEAYNWMLGVVRETKGNG
jgi:c-di-GMP-related signal transduction protein